MTTVLTSEHHLRLGRTGWLLWRDAALRGTGLPAERLLEICDEELAAAADLVDGGGPAGWEHYAKVFSAAADRLTAAIRRTAGESAFREAVAWQNPDLVRDCLDKAVAGEPRNVRGRYHELTIANYLQRYCLKNDTVGFFGPVGWARIDPEDTGLSAVPEARALSRRTTYFEGWAIDAVAEAVCARAEVWPWLRPRTAPSAVLTGWVLRRPFHKPVTLSAAEVRLLGQCDGRRTVRDLVGVPPDPALVAALLRLRESGAVQIDLAGPLATWPERGLAGRIDAIGDAAVRYRAREPLDQLVGARDAVAAAAGDPGRLAQAGQELAATFRRITGSAATRRSGRTYAGRTLVYEDTVRGCEIRLGRRVTDRLAGPLGLVLDSALWLANSVGERYEARARELLDRELARTGGETMPLLQLLAVLMPELARLAAGGAGSMMVEEAVAEFHLRWQRVLDLPEAGPGRTRRLQVSVEAIADRAAREFATGRPLWSNAGSYSPDVMLSAEDGAALARGEVDFVLGELHCASNTLESRLFVAQHPVPERLRATAAADRLDRRVVIVPRLDAPLTTTRMARADELMLPDYTYLCIGEESMTLPPGATALSILDLVVRRRGEKLIVCHRGGAEYGLLEVVGEALSALVVDGFRPFGAAAHRPRVTIDHLVLSRESWTFPAAGASWAFVKDERRRYEQARRWRSALGLPERGFFRVPVERKPMAADFRSLPLVNLLAKSIRRTAQAESGAATVAFTEMLPDLDRLWLADARGRRYTAELRMVAVASR